MSPEIVGCQFSVYPLRQEDIDGPVQAAIEAARAEGCSVRVGNLSTLLSGSEDQVFAALRAAFRAAQRQGPAVMIATLAAGMPTDELVGEIQRDVDATGQPPGSGRRSSDARTAREPAIEDASSSVLQGLDHPRAGRGRGAGGRGRGRLLGLGPALVERLPGDPVPLLLRSRGRMDDRRAARPLRHPPARARPCSASWWPPSSAWPSGTSGAS